ncbi:MAG: hypothetical protein L3J62_09830 [Gammaproteobacteria bacterium]|nr:hypothetical protein [Gammaproteobacteria bacterium]MCF6231062.1 hypothetical protein [Gammaproteobacteria bacterium]
MKRYLFLAALFCMAAVVQAEPPAGHPSVGQAHDHLQVSAGELAHQGQVLQSIPSNDYVYLEVNKKEGGSHWLAAPRAAVPLQSYIRYGDGVVMKNFFSRKHQRTFDELMFVDRIQLLGN